MSSGYTLHITYLLSSSGLTGSSYSTPIHCNYFKSIKLDTDNPYIQEINLNFPNKEDFKFLTTNISGGTGYTASEIYAIIQLVDDSVENNKPHPEKWKLVNLTNQISGHSSSMILTTNKLTDRVFKISLLSYDSYPYYNLNYLNYPSTLSVDDDKLCFGDEIYFFGNVDTQIKASVFTTDLSINLPLNEFNSSTNLTWNGESVAITEVAIYDENKNLVAIGKLNNPIIKNSTIARTIKFAIDF